MARPVTPKEYTIVWRTKQVAVSGADAARKALHLKPQGTVIATVYEGDYRVDVLIQQPKEREHATLLR
jgi:hypothetical protein